MKLQRRILIVDDNDPGEDIEDWKDAINSIEPDISSKYELNFDHKLLPVKAINELKKNDSTVDIILMDYSFGQGVCGDGAIQNGIDAIKYIRENINRYVKVIFYTTEPKERIDSERWIELINAGVFRFVQKLTAGRNAIETFNKNMAQAIVDALDDYTSIINAYERFCVEYKHILKDKKIIIGNQECTPDEILKSLKKGGSPGNEFLEEMLHLSFVKKIQSKKMGEK